MLEVGTNDYLLEETFMRHFKMDEICTKNQYNGSEDAKGGNIGNHDYRQIHRGEKHGTKNHFKVVELDRANAGPRVTKKEENEWYH